MKSLVYASPVDSDKTLVARIAVVAGEFREMSAVFANVRHSLCRRYQTRTHDRAGLIFLYVFASGVVVYALAVLGIPLRQLSHSTPSNLLVLWDITERIIHTHLHSVLPLLVTVMERSVSGDTLLLPEPLQLRHCQRVMKLHRYTNAELADIYFVYGLANGNERAVVRSFGKDNQQGSIQIIERSLKCMRTWRNMDCSESRLISYWYC
ncbi:hypothetical protein TNCV_3017241 [Trichonephila clavipes]|nr:hypothetical protein TNCV_3017241 [Trichonephila clavipes]